MWSPQHDARDEAIVHDEDIEECTESPELPFQSFKLGSYFHLHGGGSEEEDEALVGGGEEVLDL